MKEIDFNSSNVGHSCKFRTIDEEWDGRLYDGSGHGVTVDGEVIVVEFPPAYAVRIYWDGEVVDELTLQEAIE